MVWLVGTERGMRQTVAKEAGQDRTQRKTSELFARLQSSTVNAMLTAVSEASSTRSEGQTSGGTRFPNVVGISATRKTRPSQVPPKGLAEGTGGEVRQLELVVLTQRRIGDAWLRRTCSCAFKVIDTERRVRGELAQDHQIMRKAAMEVAALGRDERASRLREERTTLHCFERTFFQKVTLKENEGSVGTQLWN